MAAAPGAAGSEVILSSSCEIGSQSSKAKRREGTATTSRAKRQKNRTKMRDESFIAEASTNPSGDEVLLTKPFTYTPKSLSSQVLLHASESNSSKSKVNTARSLPKWEATGFGRVTYAQSCTLGARNSILRARNRPRMVLSSLKLTILLLLVACFLHAETHRTQMAMLGTGTPNADPDRSGPAIAVVVNDTAYLVDCGPGVVRRAAAAASKDHIAALQVPKLHIAFITHLHSDHTLGLPDLMFSPWVLGRKEPLHAYGPQGLKEMTDSMEKGWSKDIYVRTHGLEQANSTGYKVDVHEISPGVVYKDANVTVTAFLVKHGSWDQAFGYKFQTADRKIVISGDTSPTDAVIRACNGCDVLVHEVYNENAPGATGRWKTYLSAFHTSSAELGALATKAHPKLLVLYHELFEGASEQDLIDQMQRNYSGKFASAHDLDVY